MQFNLHTQTYNVSQKTRRYGSQKLLAEFSMKNWMKGGLDTLLKKVKETGSTHRT